MILSLGAFENQRRNSIIVTIICKGVWEKLFVMSCFEQKPNYHSTLAPLLLIILFSKMLKFSNEGKG
jgi:hypothetical protein